MNPHLRISLRGFRFGDDVRLRVENDGYGSRRILGGHSVTDKCNSYHRDACNAGIIRLYRGALITSTDIPLVRTGQERSGFSAQEGNPTTNRMDVCKSLL